MADWPDITKLNYRADFSGKRRKYDQLSIPDFMYRQKRQRDNRRRRGGRPPTSSGRTSGPSGGKGGKGYKYPRRLYARGRSTNIGTRLAPRNNHVLVMQSRKKRPGLRKMIRKRVKRFRKFANKIMQSGSSFSKFTLNYPPGTISWNYNLQGIAQIPMYLTGPIRGELANGLGLPVDTTAGSPTNISTLAAMNVNIASHQFELINHSLTHTYVQGWFLVASDDQNLSPIELIDWDMNSGWIDNKEYIGTNPMAGKFVKPYWRIRKKVFFDMEGGSVVKFGFKYRPGYVCRDKWDDNQTYHRGRDAALVLRCWSQGVKNKDNDNFIYDNGIVGIVHRGEWRASRYLLANQPHMTWIKEYNTPSEQGATTMTDESKQDT